MKVAILADIHANIFALDAVLDDCKNESVSYFIVAGDLIGYYYWPQPVIRRLMNDTRITCIKGNHENILKETIEDEASAVYYRKKYGSGYDFCRDTLNDAEKRWLLNLPISTNLTINGSHFSIYHGSPTSIDEYIYPDTNEETLNRCHVGLNYTVLGHTHYPFIHHLNNHTLLNPGSVGQPRDIGGQASYALIDLATQVTRIKRIPFDAIQVIAAARTHDPELDYLHRIMSRRSS